MPSPTFYGTINGRTVPLGPFVSCISTHQLTELLDSAKCTKGLPGPEDQTWLVANPPGTYRIEDRIPVSRISHPG